jgi:hypothetical protein
MSDGAKTQRERIISTIIIYKEKIIDNYVTREMGA